MKCFTADFWQFSSTAVKICRLGGRQFFHQLQAYLGFP